MTNEITFRTPEGETHSFPMSEVGKVKIVQTKNGESKVSILFAEKDGVGFTFVYPGPAEELSEECKAWNIPVEVVLE